jgi:hypothetical protein
VTAHADERRSQAENRTHAVQRMREHLAFDLREPVEPGSAPSQWLAALVAGGTAPLGAKTRQKPQFLVAFAQLLDVFVLCGCEVALTAERFRVSTGAMSKLLLVDERTARTVNQLRTQRGLRPLR